MRKYQSFGAGVGSVALAEVINHRAEKVMSDPGCEMPETYEFLRTYPNEVTVLHPIVEGCKTIEEWCHKLGHGPFKRWRSCTDKWKIRPIEKYYERPCIVYIGFTADEAHRVRIHKKGKIEYRYPMVEQNITRKMAVNIIADAGLNIPVKSGCFFCPFQPKASWWRLGRHHPELFWRAVNIDELSDKIKLYGNKPLTRLWPPQMVFEEEVGWECQFCMMI